MAATVHCHNILFKLGVSSLSWRSEPITHLEQTLTANQRAGGSEETIEEDSGKKASGVMITRDPLTLDLTGHSMGQHKARADLDLVNDYLSTGHMT